MKNMKKVLTIITLAVLCSCAKSPSSQVNEASKRYFDAWMTVNYPNLVEGNEDHLGAYVIKDEEIATGRTSKHGDVAGDSTYLFITMTARSLDGEVNSTNDLVIGKQLGSYSSKEYWGAGCFYIGEGVTYKGVEDALKGNNLVMDASKCYSGPMKVGFKRTVIVPGWLHTYNRYDTYSDYLSQITGDDEIFEILIHDYAEDIIKWQIDSMAKCKTYQYMTRNIAEASDTVKYGLYVAILDPGTDENELPTDTTVYVNYTARLLDGRVFDSNITDSTYLFSTGSVGTPMGVTLAEELSDYTITSDDDDSSSDSSLILGFCEIISRMHKYGKAVGMFTSDYAYGASSSTGKFPSYAPMIFEIELVDEPDE